MKEAAITVGLGILTIVIGYVIIKGYENYAAKRATIAALESTESAAE